MEYLGEIFTYEFYKWLFLLLIIAFAIQLFYYLFFYLKFLFYKESEENVTEFPPVSVIIAARNEAVNLERFLPYVLEQDYPNYEVIVVNHASEDESAILLKRFQAKYKNLYVTTIPPSKVSNHTKKLALTIGIKAAKNDILLFTDADCRPVSKNWISEMVKKFDSKTDFVLGYGAYEQKKGLLDKWVRTDTAFVAMQYFGFALRGLPYMGVGRNLAWRKSFFDNTIGFREHFHEPSGSDDIFVNHNANANNTKIQTNPKSFTLSRQPESWKIWFLMKRRHFGSFKYYRTKYKLLLSLEPISRSVFYILTFVFLLISFNYLVLFIFFVREIMIMSIFSAGQKRLNERNIWWFYLLYDLMQPLMNLLVYIFKKRRHRWI